MNKKVVIASAVSVAAAVTVTAGIVALVVNVLNYNTSPSADIWAEDYDDDEEEEETETSFYRDNPDPTPVPTRETQGRDYYEGGGYKGWDNYYIIQDFTTEEIVAEYEYYHDLAHAYDFEELKNFDKELKRPCYSQVDSTGYGVYMFYDQILPDEHIDHIVSFNIEGTESTHAVEFTMKVKIHDPDKAMEVYNTFVDLYSEGAQDTEFYNMLNTFDKGIRIKVNDSESRIVGYKRIRDDYGKDVYLIYVSEDY